MIDFRRILVHHIFYIQLKEYSNLNKQPLFNKTFFPEIIQSNLNIETLVTCEYNDIYVMYIQ